MGGYEFPPRLVHVTSKLVVFSFIREWTVKRRGCKNYSNNNIHLRFQQKMFYNLLMKDSDRARANKYIL